MPFVKRPDARIWWDQSGTGDPILLIMGHAYGADMWHRTAPGLAASYRVIRFDNRGIGRSSDPPGPYPVQLMADDALAVLDAASAASAHVYGVSMGGFIALQLALDHPGRVRSLTLGCTAASAEGASRGALLARVRSLVPAAALNRIAWKLLSGPGTPASRRAEDQQIVRRTRASARGRHGQLTGAASFDVTGGLAEIRIPTLVMPEPRTASSPPPTLNDSPTASPEPGSWSSLTPATFTPPTPPMPPTRRSCASSAISLTQPTAPAPARLPARPRSRPARSGDMMGSLRPARGRSYTGNVGTTRLPRRGCFPRRLRLRRLRSASPGGRFDLLAAVGPGLVQRSLAARGCDR